MSRNAEPAVFWGSIVPHSDASREVELMKTVWWRI